MNIAQAQALVRELQRRNRMRLGEAWITRESATSIRADFRPIPTHGIAPMVELGIVVIDNRGRVRQISP